MPACLICEGCDLLLVETHPQVPVAQNQVWLTRDAALTCPTGTLHLVRCRRCGFVWNTAFDAARVLYNATYDNDQTHSPTFAQHLQACQERLVAHTQDLAAVTLLEVGCGQGGFLGALSRQLGTRLVAAYGFDPAFRSGPADPPAGVQFVADYFTPQSAHLLSTPPNLVVSRHTIEHLPDPMAFLRTLRAVCPPGGLLALETPNVDWSLENGMICDFYYEHCSLFNPQSLAMALETSGFTCLTLEKVFHGQYLWAMAQASEGAGERRLLAGDTGDFGYPEKRDACLSRMLQGLHQAQQAGEGVALWGAGAKGSTLAWRLASMKPGLAAVIDRNPRKQGTFLPLTGLLVVSPEEAWARGVRTAIAVNPAYADEIRALCHQADLAIRMMSL